MWFRRKKEFYLVEYARRVEKETITKLKVDLERFKGKEFLLSPIDNFVVKKLN